MLIRFNITYPMYQQLPKHLQYLHQAVEAMEDVIKTAIQDLEDFINDDTNFYKLEVEQEVAIKYLETFKDVSFRFHADVYYRMYTMFENLEPYRNGTSALYAIAMRTLDFVRMIDEGLKAISKVTRKHDYRKYFLINVLPEKSYEVAGEPDFVMSFEYYFKALLTKFERTIPNVYFHFGDIDMSKFEE